MPKTPDREVGGLCRWYRVGMSHEIVTVRKALGQIDSRERYAELVRQGTTNAGIYAPHQTDEQEPHDQDEFYVIVNGSGFFVADGDRQPFSPGDLIYVAAGVEHHFEDFTPDFATWAIFCDRAD